MHAGASLAQLHLASHTTRSFSMLLSAPEGFFFLSQQFAGQFG